MALDFSKLQEEVTRNKSVDDSAATLIRGIATQIEAAIAADDVEDATNLNELVSNLRSSTDNLASAVSEGTPAQPGGGGETGGGGVNP